MTHDELTPEATEARRRASELIEQGIGEASAGNLAAALDTLEEAARIAETHGFTDLASAAFVNRGYAHWVQGDIETARGHFMTGAELARANNDWPQLASALTNYAATSRQLGRWEEAVMVYEDLLPLVRDDAEASSGSHQDCGLCKMELGDFDAAELHLVEGERVAREAGLPEMLVNALINRGILQQRRGDPIMSAVLYEEAVTTAAEHGLTELQAAAVLTLAQGYRQVGEFDEAVTRFEEAEELFRALGDRAQMANALFWHGIALRGAGKRDLALAAWRQEEAIRRELEQWSDLGDCLFEQASVLREREEFAALEGIYGQAEEAYRRGGDTRSLVETLVLHGYLLREQDRAHGAFALTQDAVAAAEDRGDAYAMSRARTLRGLLAADREDAVTAAEELRQAEDAGLAVGSHELVTSVHAARAYALARAGASVEEVREQLAYAFEYGLGFASEAYGRAAVGETLDDIEARAGEPYAALVESFRAELDASRDVTFVGDAAAPDAPAADAAAADAAAPAPAE